MKVEVFRSPRRRKTVQAREVGGVLHLSIPANMSKAEEEHWIAEMLRRMQRKTATDLIDLGARARLLAGRYGLKEPVSIRWVDNQEWRWGSCTPAEGSIRISSKLAREPQWVIDYVLVHELAHLSEGGHGARFWSLVERYPLTERARGFLIARGLEHATGEDGQPEGDVADDRGAGSAPGAADGVDAVGADTDGASDAATPGPSEAAGIVAIPIGQIGLFAPGELAG